MAVERIPLDSSKPYIKYKIDIEGLFYTFEFYYNSIMDIWTINILTEDEEQILMGIPLRVDRQLLGDSFNYIEALFDGALYAFCNSSSKADPGYTGFDSEYDLIYIGED